MTDRLARRSALFVAVLLSLAGCTASTDTSSSSTHQAPSATSSSAAPSSRGRTDCGSLHFPDPAAPAYAGRGPHPAVAGDAAPDDLTQYPLRNVFTLPDEWIPPEDESTRTSTRHDVSRAQLVICLADVRRRSDTPIGTCDYPTVRAWVYPAIHTFEVYEAKTARQVTTFTLRGDETPDLSCPPYFSHDADDDSVDIAQFFKDETLLDKLRPLITRPVR
ncbi:hypothetical protein ACWD1Y_10160 [Streptomyces sp. NPDC002814]